MGSDPADGREGEYCRGKRLTAQSGVTFHEAQVALAKIYVGSDDLSGDTDEVVNIEKPHDQTTKVDQIGKKDTVAKAVRLPRTVDEVSRAARAEHPADL